MKILYSLFFVCITMQSLCGYKNDSVSLMSGIAGVALTTGALVHGKIDLQSVGMGIMGIGAIGLGHAVSTQPPLYIMVELPLCLLGWLLGMMEGNTRRCR